MTDPPPTSAMPPARDPRWSAWCRPVERLLSRRGPLRLGTIRAYKEELKLTEGFITNAVAWLDLEGKIVHGSRGWELLAPFVEDPPAEPAPPKPKRKRVNPPKICELCRESYVPTSSRSKYCGKICRSTASARRNHERRCDAWVRSVQAPRG